MNAPAERQAAQARPVRHRLPPARAGDAPAIVACVERDTTAAALVDRAGWPAASPPARPARLQRCERLPGLPRLVAWDGRRLRALWIAGEPMHRSPRVGPEYFREALRLLRRMHAAGIVHNDLAKEPNWLVTPDGLGRRWSISSSRRSPRHARTTVPHARLRRPAPPAEAQAHVLSRSGSRRGSARSSQRRSAVSRALGAHRQAALPAA